MNDWTDGIVTVHVADVLTGLAALPDCSVQCVVTSPPYWGLRDYGTATWNGGDDACDHKGVVPTLPTDPGIRMSTLEGGKKTTTAQASARGFRHECGKCGAERVDAQLGLEATPELYVDRMVAVFREVRRVLRDDGTLWLNMGDCYATHPPGNVDVGATSSLNGVDSPKYRETLRRSVGQKRDSRARHPHDEDDRTFRDKPFSSIVGGLKPKDLVGMPWRLAFALQEDGWWLRSDIVWSKPNPMPESITDRPTKAHEYLFLLTKRARYFYDADAIREASESDRPDMASKGVRTGLAYLQQGDGPPSNNRYAEPNGAVRSPHGQGFTRRSGNLERKTGERDGRINESMGTSVPWEGFTRNKRTVWTIATQPYPQAHFATFPEALVEPCILAGTSARGRCPECGAPWTRISETEYTDTRPGGNGPQSVERKHLDRRLLSTRATAGWVPTCVHIECEPVACVVLDPFAGSGTTLAVSKRLNRDAIGIELNPAYLPLIVARVRGEMAQVPLPY